MWDSNSSSLFICAMLWFIIIVFISQIMFDCSKDLYVTSRELPLDTISYAITENTFWSRQFPAYVLGEAECFPNKVLYSDTPPQASTLYPFIHHFWQKWYLFHIPSIDKCYPFHIPSLEHFNCCNCTILLICINNKTRKLSYLLTAIK